MKDVFELMDNFWIRLPIRDYKFLRKLALWFSLSMIPLWLILGFDSGVGMLEIWAKQLPNLLSNQISFQEWVNHGYSVYGTTFHFSAFVIYGLLFYGLSKHFDGLGIVRSKNIFYAFCLALLNISIYEHFWMGSYVYIQDGRSIAEWYVTDFWFMKWYFFMLVLGALTLLAFYVDSYRLDDSRIFKFNPNKRMVVVFSALIAGIIFWYYYPFPVGTVTKGVWVSKELFPQTYYNGVYLENNLLHLVGVLVKAMFAYTQFYILSRFKR